MVKPLNFDFVALAGSQMGSAIASIPEEKRKEEEYKTKRALLDKQLKQIDVNEESAYDLYYKNIEAAADEWEKEFNDGRGVAMARQAYPITIAEAIKNPEVAADIMLKAEQKWDKFLEKKKIEKFRSAPATISTEGPAGPGYQPSAKPQVSVGADRGLPDIQSEVENQMLSQPRTEVSRAAPDMYSQAQQLGITETPQFKSDYQQQQNVEAGMISQPDQTKGQYLSTVSAAGIDPSTGAAKEIGASKMTEKDIATNKRLADQAAQREKYQAERLKIDAWRAAISQNLLTSDERLKIMTAKADNKTEQLKIGLQIKKLEADFKAKAGKTDPYTFQPILSQEEADATLKEISQLSTDLAILEDFNNEYNGLIREKGGVRPAATPTAGAAPRPRRSLDSFSK